MIDRLCYRRYVTIEWANCSAGEETDLVALEPREDTPRRAWLDPDHYHDGYIGVLRLLSRALPYTFTSILIRK